MSNAALHSCAVLALLAGCKRAPPAQPRYCDQDLTGVWVNASAPSFAYRLEDQGTSVRGEFFKREVDGGEAPPDTDEESMRIELRRSANALSGTMKTRGETPGGRSCDLEFAVRVSSCQPEALQVVGETSYDVREDCTRQKQEDGGEIPPQLTEYRWERAPSPKVR